MVDIATIIVDVATVVVVATIFIDVATVVVVVELVSCQPILTKNNLISLILNYESNNFFDPTILTFEL